MKPMFNHPIQWITGVFFSLIIVSVPGITSAGGNETLVVITGNTGSPVETYFEQTLLPEIKTIASSMGVDVTVENGNKKLPKEIGITPLLVYQNHLGRSVYQGRTTTLKRIKNFIRTSRRIPQGEKPNTMNTMHTRNMGRAFVWAPIKISPLGGTRPDGYENQAFQTESLDAIDKGFKHFTKKSSVAAGRSDRGFYMDFYPWLSEDGTLFISLALFSQFHCKKPVFEHKITGPWEGRATLFKKAGFTMEQEVMKRLSDPTGGDGFDPVPESTPVISWNEFGHPLPEPPAKPTGVIPHTQPLPLKWTLKPPFENDDPAIQFRFPPPLDTYSGEVITASGKLVFAGKKGFNGLSGFVRADTFSVTMGEEDLDKTIKTTIFLDSETYPFSQFKIKQAAMPTQTLSFGRLSITEISGIFSLKGKHTHLTLPVSFEPVIGEDNTPELIVSGSFSIDLRHFHIEGATGPVPEKYTLLFDLNLSFTEANNQP